MYPLNLKRILLISCILYWYILIIYCDSPKEQKGISIVPDTENTETKQQENIKQKPANIHTPDDLNTMDAMNPELIAALREINDDPSYLKPGEGELVDLSQIQMDPEKLEEMIEIFDWIESQLPPDDPQQIQKILNAVENHIDINNTNYTDDSLLLDLIILPEYLYQVDNGVDFMKMNGVPILLKTYNKYKLLNINNNNTNITLNYRILSQIMDVIGVASQNNPNAIQYVHQSNMVSFIIDELNNIYLNYKNNNISINGQLINKLLFTLSSITRQSDIGLQHLENKNGPKVLYKCGKLLSKEIYKQENDYKNMERAFKKLLTMVSDIVVLNGNKIGYSQMFLNSGKWCGFMIEKGLMFHTESVLQFINYALQRNYCVKHKMLNSLENKLNKIIDQNTPPKNKNNNNNEYDDEEEYYDDNLLTQSTNMLIYIKKNFNIDKKTEL